MFQLKGCLRCHGDLVLRGDGADGAEWHCLQCGRDFQVQRTCPKYTPSGLDVQIPMLMQPGVPSHG